jgi:BASS family bile acid:Na+ symporter
VDAQAILKAALSASILLLVFALGLRSSFADATSLIRQFLRPPRRLLRALIAMYVVVPAVAIALGLMFDLPVSVRAGMLAMAIAPIPPILPGKQLKFGGDSAHVFGLLVAVSLCAIVLVPIVLHFIGPVFGHDEVAFSPAQVARLIGSTVLLPLLAGLTLRQLAPRWAERLAPWVSRLGTVLLVAGVLPVLVAAAPAIAALVGDGSLLVIAALVGCAILAGHALGGPGEDGRKTLAIATANRHPGVALAVATLNAPAASHVGAAVLLYVLLATVLTALYGRFALPNRPAAARR